MGGQAGLLQCLLLLPPHYANIVSIRELYSLAERGLLTAVFAPFYLNNVSISTIDIDIFAPTITGLRLKIDSKLPELFILMANTVNRKKYPTYTIKSGFFQVPLYIYFHHNKIL